MVPARIGGNIRAWYIQLQGDPLSSELDRFIVHSPSCVLLLTSRCPRSAHNWAWALLPLHTQLAAGSCEQL